MRIYLSPRAYYKLMMTIKHSLLTIALVTSDDNFERIRLEKTSALTKSIVSRVSSPPLRVRRFRYLIIFSGPLLRGWGPRYTPAVHLRRDFCVTSVRYGRQTGLFTSALSARRQREGERTQRGILRNGKGRSGPYTGFSGMPRHNCDRYAAT